MIINGGHTIEVYRDSGRDRHGDRVLQLVGEIKHVIFQWSTPDLVGEAQETDSSSLTVFCPRNASLKLRAKDRFKFQGETYAVVGGRAWDERHPVTGSDYGYYTVEVEVMG